MAIIMTVVQGDGAGSETETEYAPCRNCGAATPLVPVCQTVNGLLCLSCRDEPGGVQSLGAWLLKRKAHLKLELMQVEEELARLEAEDKRCQVPE